MFSQGHTSKSRDWKLYRLALVAADLFCFLAAPLFAVWLLSLPALGSHPPGRQLMAALLFAPVYLPIFVSQGLYDSRNLLGGAREYGSAFAACMLGLAAIILIDFLFRLYLSREWIVLSALFVTALVGGARFALRKTAYLLRRRGHFTSRTIVIGADADGLAVAAKLSEPGSGIQVVGLLDDYVPVGTVLNGNLQVLGTPSALAQLAERERAREAVVVPQAVPWETLQMVIADVALAPNGVRVHLAAGFYDLLATSVAPAQLNGVPLLTVNKARLGGLEAGVKLALDYVLATMLFVFAAPVMLITCLRLLTAGGNVIERRMVLGRGGHRFAQLSFAPSQLLPSEFLRKLPGLINVLFGQLSLVGPRPIAVDESNDTMEQRMTLTIRPGLTGPWRQVEDPQDQALMDLYYIRSYSIWLDLQVLLTRLLSRIRPGSQPPCGMRMRVERGKGLVQLTRFL
jgi:lipopolysaccharide/colanic/teichoic acid biosynthesis glycosyltransferase